MNDKRIGIRIPNELLDKIETEAKRKNISVSAVIKIILSEYFENK